MKHFAIALIVIALIAADFGAEWLHFTASSQHNWGVADSVGIVFAGAWFWHHREKAE